jgi:prevent-host-death family protein
MFVLGPNEKGDIAEAEIALAAIRAGCGVSRPLIDHPPYDLVIEIAGRLLRVQCKWAALKNGSVEVRFGRCTHSPTRGYVRAGYDADEIDAFAAFCEPLRCCYLIPIDAVAGQRWVSLRVDPPKNGQRAAIHYASDYELAGAVAQLGRALPWHGRGRGFESHQLHSPEASCKHEVGAHQFRNHFGYWMERAAAGDEIVITRRGRRFARLGPPDPQLTPEDGDQ